VGRSEAAFAFGVHFCRTTHPHLLTVKDGHLIKSRRLIPSKSLSQTSYSSHPPPHFIFILTLAAKPVVKYIGPYCNTKLYIYTGILYARDSFPKVLCHWCVYIYYLHCICKTCSMFFAITLRIIVGILCVLTDEAHCRALHVKFSINDLYNTVYIIWIYIYIYICIIILCCNTQSVRNIISRHKILYAVAL